LIKFVLGRIVSLHLIVNVMNLTPASCLTSRWFCLDWWPERCVLLWELGAQWKHFIPACKWHFVSQHWKIWSDQLWAGMLLHRQCSRWISTESPR